MLPEQLITLCRHLNDSGGIAYLVGGAVRDLTLGLIPKDFDIEVYGIAEQALHDALKMVGRTEMVGKQFGVIKLWLDHLEIDVALPRTEIKTGEGHRGFDVKPDSSISPETASLRRDFTINAMMYDPIEERLLDFHQGRDDLTQRVLRHISPAFAEDPLRVLRGMQLAARFKLVMHPETIKLCRTLLSEADTLPSSRIWIEWQKWCHSKYPSYGLKVLEQSGWIKLYPELEAMMACPQDPTWHPEGDVWVHTLQVVDRAACIALRNIWDGEIRENLLLAALCHDVGKPDCTITSPDGSIRSPGHSQTGRELTRSFLSRIAAPGRIGQSIAPLVQEHMTHMHGDPTPRAIRNLAHRLEPSSIEMWEALVEADASGRAPSPASRPAESWLREAEALQHHQEKPAPIVTGAMLLSMDVSPGPEMGALIKQAYEAQLNGDFNDDESAKAWCKRYKGHL